MGDYLRRSIKSHLEKVAKDTGVALVSVKSKLEGVITVTVSKSTMPEDALLAWIFTTLQSYTGVVNPVEGFIWLTIPQADKCKGSEVQARFITTALLNANNGIQAHSGHKANAEAWVALAKSRAEQNASAVTPVSEASVAASEATVSKSKAKRQKTAQAQS